MKVIYHGAKHRRPARLIHALGFGIVAIWVVATVFMRSDSTDQVVPMLLIILTIGIVVVVACMSVLRYFSTPIRVSVLESGIVQFHTLGGQHKYRADGIKRVTYVYESPSSGNVTVRTTGKTWRLPCDQSEADDIIQALISLNPNILAERRKARSSGG